MTEIEEFKAFFKGKGVVFREWMNLNNHKAITVAQAHFYFNDQGRYIGVEDDEMGNYYERKDKE